MAIDLRTLLHSIVDELSDRVAKLVINDIYLDSRQVTPSSLFIALNGALSDGRRFISAACQRGASAVLCQADSACDHGQIEWLDGIPIISCWELSRSLEHLAVLVYPHNKTVPMIIGVTGTNGKSTTTHLIASLAKRVGVDCAVMGTLGNGRPGMLETSANTTADIFTIHRQLTEYARQGIKLVAMEVSSHGLVQQRVAGVPFRAAVFTNLTRDHLDYHDTMEAYAEAKSGLFNGSCLQHRIINGDDVFGAELIKRYSEALSVSTHDKRARWYAEPSSMTPRGCQATLTHNGHSHLLLSPLLGRFNLDNLVAAIATLVELGFDETALIHAAQGVNAVPGRMELFGSGPTVVVDYAHTPDALDKALEGMREHCDGRLICIFGCGGDRDSGKRPLMAKSAEQRADRVIVTDDNPRTESAKNIVQDIMSGFVEPDKVGITHSRRDAIAQAIAEAADGDMILIAGKGHEQYQIIGNERVDYDERAVVAKLVGGCQC